MFRIKICGIMTVEDARLAAAAGADAIGLNFYEPSPRCVGQQRAAEIVAALPAGVAKVGVFVNAPAAMVCDLADRLGLDWIQLHGDEPPEYLASLDDRPVIRALRCRDEAIRSAEDYLQRCAALGRLPGAVMIDAYHPGQYGGTGRLAPWNALAEEPSWRLGLPLVLSGGLTPENVAEAITLVKPAAVDVASGVEVSPGRKDRGRVERFVGAAIAALATVRQEPPRGRGG